MARSGWRSSTRRCQPRLRVASRTVGNTALVARPGVAPTPGRVSRGHLLPVVPTPPWCPADTPRRKYSVRTHKEGGCTRTHERTYVVLRDRGRLHQPAGVGHHDRLVPGLDRLLAHVVGHELAPAQVVDRPGADLIAAHRPLQPQRPRPDRPGLQQSGGVGRRRTLPLRRSRHVASVRIAHRDNPALRDARGQRNTGSCRPRGRPWPRWPVGETSRRRRAWRQRGSH